MSCWSNKERIVCSSMWTFGYISNIRTVVVVVVVVQIPRFGLTLTVYSVGAVGQYIVENALLKPGNAPYTKRTVIHGVVRHNVVAAVSTDAVRTAVHNTEEDLIPATLDPHRNIRIVGQTTPKETITEGRMA